MDLSLAKSVLMKLQIGEFVTEHWLIRHADCPKELLDEMVAVGWLTKKNRDPSDVMSDTRYALTDAGQKTAWS